MSISSAKTSPATDAGFTLIELMVALAISGMITLGVTTFFDHVIQMNAKLHRAADLEDARSVLRGRLDCSKACSGLRSGTQKLGNLSVNVTCSTTFNDARVTFTDPKGAGALFSLDEWICRARRPKQCIDACHNNGTMLERGYFMPAIDNPVTPPDGLQCPTGKMIGVDFSLGRVICARPSPLPTGPRCSEEGSIDLNPRDEFHIGLAGNKPCLTYDQLQTRAARLDGKLVIDLAGGYEPNVADVFTVVVAESFKGRFTNIGDDDRVHTKEGSFLIGVREHSLLLYGYRPNKR